VPENKNMFQPAADVLADMANITDVFETSGDNRPAFTSELARSNKAVAVGFATGMELDRTKTALSNGDVEPLVTADKEAKATSPTSEQRFDQLLKRGDDNLIDLVQDHINKEKVASGDGGDFYLTPNMVLDNPAFNSSLARLMKNREIAMEKIQAAVDEVNGGIASDIWDFIDWGVLRGITIGEYEDITRRTERRGEEFLHMMMTEDFGENPAVIDEIINDAREEGFFDSDNLFALSNLKDEMTNAGYDPEADIWQALAIAGVVGPLASTH